MPEYPEKKTQTFTIGSGLPTVHSINGFALQQRGYKITRENTYEKDGEKIIYDGVHWSYNGNRVEFFEDIDKLNDKK